MRATAILSCYQGLIEPPKAARNAPSPYVDGDFQHVTKITLPLMHVNVSPRTESGWTRKNTD